MASVVWWLSQQEAEVMDSPIAGELWDRLGARAHKVFKLVKEFSAGSVFGERNDIDADSEAWCEPMGIHCNQCVGILVSKPLARMIWELNLPGTLTDLYLRRWHP